MKQNDFVIGPTYNMGAYFCLFSAITSITILVDQDSATWCSRDIELFAKENTCIYMYTYIYTYIYIYIYITYIYIYTHD